MIFIIKLILKKVSCLSISSNT